MRKILAMAVSQSEFRQSPLPTEARIRPDRMSFRRIVTQFFCQADWPVNLAVFRIALFAAILTCPDLPRAVWYSTLPHSLIVAPYPLQQLLNHMPINAGAASAAFLLLLCVCFTGMIGWFSRTSALLAALLGFYVLGIPQFFGKIGHFSHELIWFALILAVSKCGDVLSVDALVNACRRADRGCTEPPAPSRAYALPLRFVWLLMGIAVYGFPGFWKIYHCGPQWIFGDNLQYRLYYVWSRFSDGCAPLVRIDQIPLACTLGAAGTIMFELGFIFLIFFPAGRVIAGVSGLLFHTAIYLCMRINYVPLQVCLAALFDWHSLFRSMGRRLFAEELLVVYDHNDPVWRRVIAAARVMDVFGRIEYQCADTKTDVHDGNEPRLLVRIGSTQLTGFVGAVALARRIPVCWPLLPLVMMPGSRKRVERVFGANVPRSSPATINRGVSAQPNAGPRSPVVIMGCLLLSINISYGVNRNINGWPFSCYPLFDKFPSRKFEIITLSALDANGQPIAIGQPRLNFGHSRWAGLMHRLLSRNPSDRNRCLADLWQFWKTNDQSVRNAKTVRFYKETTVTGPDMQSPEPVSRELLLEMSG